MYSADIHRDLTSYRPKVLGLLTARSLACTTAALAAGVAAHAYLTWVLGLPFEQVSVLIYAATIPFWAAGYWEPDGMRPEAWLPLWLRHRLGASRLAYTLSPRYVRASGQRPHRPIEAGASGSAQREGDAFAFARSRAWGTFRARRGIERWNIESDE